MQRYLNLSLTKRLTMAVTAASRLQRRSASFAVVCLCLLGLLVLENSSAAEENRELYLLNVIPYPDPDPEGGWDYGLNASVGALVALEEINKRSDLLPGYTLRVLNVSSEACARSVITSGVVNLYKELIYSNVTVVGVTGLFCSSTTSMLAPLLDHPRINYVALAASNSPLHRDTEKYPLLFHSISSSAVYNEVMLRLMKEFGWSKIALISDSQSVYFSGTGRDFVDRANLTNVTSIDQRNTELEAVNSMLQNELRIMYAPVAAFEAAKLVCGAYKKGLSYPGVMFIFHDHTLDDIVEQAPNTSCSEKEVKKGMEGMLLMHYRLKQADKTKVLDSGISYDDFYNNYTYLANSLGLKPDIYGAVQYDQVWAFARALNLSIEKLNGMNLSLNSYGLGNQQITKVIFDSLTAVSFEGATGRIQFRENRETLTTVEIFQIINESARLIATYFPHKINFSEEGDFLKQRIPSDHFDSVIDELPLWLVVCICIISALIMTLTTVTLVLFFYWRHHPGIKATSPYLSLCIFAGCYVLCFDAMVHAVHDSCHSVENLFIIFCYIDMWFTSLGFLLIFGTIFMRMLRIYWVFQHFGKTSRFWRDPFLFLGIMAICLIDTVVVPVHAIIDQISLKRSEEYTLAKPMPYYRVYITCSSRYMMVWRLVPLAYTGIILLLVVFLAVKTRHIKRAHFKDTKKVNAFVYSVVTILISYFVLWYIFEVSGLHTAAHVMAFVVLLSVVTMCQLLLFVPKTIPLFLTKKVKLYSMLDRSKSLSSST